jgi:hypothetical protein
MKQVDVANHLFVELLQDSALFAPAATYCVADHLAAGFEGATCIRSASPYRQIAARNEDIPRSNRDLKHKTLLTKLIFNEPFLG